MASVTQRIKVISQPRGGYLNTKIFDTKQFFDDLNLNDENIDPSLVGTAVDYLTRFVDGDKDAFKISLLGATIIRQYEAASRLLFNIKGLDNNSIINACKLVGYDVCYRAGESKYKPIEDINADKNTIQNINIMVNRCLEFIANYGPVTKYGFTLDGGHTKTITDGDGDFLTKDTLWDFKVSKYKPDKNATLQLLVYYIMGKRSITKEFEDVTNIGIFNPRLNKVYRLNIVDIDPKIIKKVEQEVICY
jgi:hypothetical protein